MNVPGAEGLFVLRTLTGMPAWGAADPHADEDSWKLVHFIRHLPALTPAEIAEMEALNPRSPSELEEERQDQQFLNEPALDPPGAAQRQHETGQR